MASGSSNPWDRSNGLSTAVAELRACSDEMQAFVAGVFENLEEMADQLSTRERVGRHAQQQAERKALQDQIEQLASVTAELAASVAEQKRLTGDRRSNGRETTR
jgi:hypothetical protein